MAGEDRIPDGPLWDAGQLEQGVKAADLADVGEIRCAEKARDDRDEGHVAKDPLPRRIREGILEQGRCRHPLSALLTAVMVLDDVDCAAGCGHRLYSDRGPVECPCHWPAGKVIQVARALQSCEDWHAAARANGPSTDHRALGRSTHQGPATAHVAVHENANLVRQSSGSARQRIRQL